MEIDILAILFQAINFGIVAFVVWKFLLGPIRSVLDQRSEKVAEGMKAAEANLKAQRELDQKVQEELKQARQEAKDILKEAKKQAEKEALEIVEKAKQQAKTTLDKERDALKASIEAERKALRGQLSQLVTEATRAVLQQGLSEADQKKLVASQIDQLKNVTFA